jgi:hypothetical protein
VEDGAGFPHGLASVLKNGASRRDPALCGFWKCVVRPKLYGWEAGKLEVKPFISSLSLLSFQPPSLQLIVGFAEGPMLVFQYPVSF